MYQLVVARKICNSIGMYGPAILILILSFTWNNTILSMILLIFAVGLNCGCNTGMLINYLDLSPNFVGYLMGISTFPSNITSILGPLVVGFVVTDIVCKLILCMKNEQVLIFLIFQSDPYL